MSQGKSTGIKDPSQHFTSPFTWSKYHGKKSRYQQLFYKSGRKEYSYTNGIVGLPFRRKNASMTNLLKRQIYQLCLIGMTCFVIGLFLYDLGELGIDTLQMIFFCYILVFAGIIFCFKALEIWSSWLEDKSEDPDDERQRRNIYPLTFYIQAGTMTLIVVFLFVWTMARSEPDAQGQLMTIFGLIVVAASLFLGHLSSYLV